MWSLQQICAGGNTKPERLTCLKSHEWGASRARTWTLTLSLLLLRARASHCSFKTILALRQQHGTSLNIKRDFGHISVNTLGLGSRSIPQLLYREWCYGQIPKWQYCPLKYTLCSCVCTHTHFCLQSTLLNV